MGHKRSLPGQKSLLPSPAEELIAALPAWPEEELLRAGRAISHELLRRHRPIPVAWPIAEAVATIGLASPLTSDF